MDTHLIEPRRVRAKATTQDLAAVGVAVSILILITLQIAIWHVNGLWLDELFTLWATDPATPFRADFLHRIATDTNPPGYSCLLYLMRLLVSDGRIAALVLNVLFLAAAALATYLSAKRARLVALALLSFSAFLLSGPVAYYLPEARTYLGALSVTFVASWFAALQLANLDRQQSLIGFIGIGAIAALMHLYAAFYCGCLSAGLLVVALMRPGRRPLLKSSLALGGASVATTGLWLPTALHSMGSLSWIQFNLQSVSNVILSASVLSGAPILFTLAFIPTACVKTRKDSCAFEIALAVTFLLFVTVPILVSFRHPIIVDRYWLIGAPGMIVFAGFQLRRLHLESVDDNGAIVGRNLRKAVFGLVFVWVVLGLTAAYHRFAYKMIWSGAAEVEALLPTCPAQSVRVGLGLNIDDGKLSLASDGLQYFAVLTGQPADKFVPIGGRHAPSLALTDAKCSVVGWAEHLAPSQFGKLSDGDLLRLLDIAASPAEVDIRRHYAGFVVFRRADRVPPIR